MGFGTALARLEGLGAADLSPRQGPPLGPLACGLFLPLAQALRAGIVRTPPARGLAPGIGIVLGRIGSGACLVLGVLVGAAIAFPSIGGVLDDPAPVVRVAELGDFAVQLDMFFWIDPAKLHEATEVTDRVLAWMRLAPAAAGIDIPYPTTRVLLHDKAKDTDGDRARRCEGWPARGGGRDSAPRRHAVRVGEGGRSPRPNGPAGQES